MDCGSNSPIAEFELIGFSSGCPSPGEEVFEEQILWPFRSAPLDEKTFLSLFDSCGRLIDEHSFRKAVFKGGVTSKIRSDAWIFLFEVYPCHSTRFEQQAIKEKCIARYAALKDCWQTKLKAHWPQLNLTYWDLAPTLDMINIEEDEAVSKNLLCVNENASARKSSSSVLDDAFYLGSIIEIEARTFASRVQCGMSHFLDSLRYITKDVPRTEKYPLQEIGGEGVCYGQFELAADGQYNSNCLIALRDVLATFAFFCPNIGYVQGMNDILLRFLTVLESEAMAFWCFHAYVNKIQSDFLADGMLYKIQLLRKLLGELDSDLTEYLEHCGSDDMIFCHKWLLLCFLREFNWIDGMRILEIVSSHHLELNSLIARNTKFQKARSPTNEDMNIVVSDMWQFDFTFDLFICAAILILNRKQIFKCTDSSQIFQTISRLSGRMNIDQILSRAESLFYKYCQRSVMDAFVLV